MPTSVHGVPLGILRTRLAAGDEITIQAFGSPVESATGNGEVSVFFDSDGRYLGYFAYAHRLPPE